MRWPWAFRQARRSKRWLSPPPPRHYTEQKTKGVTRTGQSGAIRVLVCEGRVPRPENSAGDMAVAGVIRNFQRVGFDVTFLPWEKTAKDDRAATELANRGVTVISATDCKSPVSFLRRSGRTFDIVFLMRLEVAEQLVDVVRRHASGATIIYCAHDLVFLRREREALATNASDAATDLHATRARELALMRRADHTALISRFEQELVRVLAPDIPTTLFPFLSIPVADDLVPMGKRRGTIVFVGSFKHAPNTDAVIWFVENCWPLVYAELPEARFEIIGADPPDSIVALGDNESVACLGHVDDLSKHLSCARLSVAPMRFGAGIKGKIAFALGSGTPVVTTLIGAEGMDLEHEDTAMIADSAEQFSKNVVRLFHDDELSSRIAKNGHRHAAEHFSENACEAGLLSVLKDAGARPAGQSYSSRAKSNSIRPQTMDEKLNILYVSAFPTHPTSHGNRAAQLWFCNSLRSIGNIHFALFDSPAVTTQGLLDMRDHWDTLDVITYGNSMAPMTGGVSFDGWYEDGLGQDVQELCERYAIDVVICAYVFQSKILEFLPSHVLTIIDTLDKMTERYDLLEANGVPREFFSCSSQQEARYLRRADLVLAITRAETEYFDSICTPTAAIFAPHLPPSNYLDLPPPASALRCGVTASANMINLMAVRDLLRACQQRWGETWPIEMTIAGEVARLVGTLDPDDQRLFFNAKVNLAGFVPEISNFYASIDVIAVPISVGTGMNIKMIEALRHGVPVLSTAAGAKGVPTTHPLHLHQDVTGMAETLNAAASDRRTLDGLRSASVDTYDRFLLDAGEAIEKIAKHPKLVSYKTSAHRQT